MYTYIYELTGLHIVHMYSKSIIAYSLLLYRKNTRIHTDTQCIYTDTYAYTQTHPDPHPHTETHLCPQTETH